MPPREFLIGRSGRARFSRASICAGSRWTVPCSAGLISPEPTYKLESRRRHSRAGVLRSCGSLPGASKWCEPRFGQFRKRLPRQGRDGVRIDGQRSVARRLPASGFLVACSARYCCPPAASSACRIISFSARVILFVEPLGRPFPAPGGRVPFGAAISKPSLV